MMSHVTQILLRMQKVRRKIQPKLGEEECQFVEGKGTINTVYVLRTLIEQ